MPAKKVIASVTFYRKVAEYRGKNVYEYSFSASLKAAVSGFVRCIRIPAPKGAKLVNFSAKNTIRGREIWVRRSLIKQSPLVGLSQDTHTAFSLIFSAKSWKYSRCA